jgi:flagellar basal body-associated protein FliL
MTIEFRRVALGALAAMALLPGLLAPLAAAQAAEAPPKKAFEFVTLGDFTVNLPSAMGSRRMGYVVVSVTLETNSERTQSFKDLSPLLRQAVLRKLMAMSVRQELRPGQTDPATLRDSLYDSLAAVQEDGLKDVVITRLLHS